MGRTWGESSTHKANARRHVAHANVLRKNICLDIWLTLSLGYPHKVGH
jgi:hypothetical protein